MGWDQLVMQARQGRGPLRHARAVRQALREIRLPVIKPFWNLVYAAAQALSLCWKFLTKLFYREPVFRTRCQRAGRRLVLEGQVPQIFGDGRIEVGDDVRIGTRNTWIVGFKVSDHAELIIGDRTSVNYQTVISAAVSVRIGSDVMIAGNVQIFDNISHPVSPARRLARDSFRLDECRPVVIGNNAWIGTGAIIMRASVGENSIVAAGAVVTKPVPPNTLVAGNPARVIRAIGD